MLSIVATKLPNKIFNGKVIRGYLINGIIFRILIWFAITLGLTYLCYDLKSFYSIFLIIC